MKITLCGWHCVKNFVDALLVSHCCHNKWVKCSGSKIQTYYLTVPKVRSLKWVLGLCSFWRLWGGIFFLAPVPWLMALPLAGVTTPLIWHSCLTIVPIDPCDYTGLTDNPGYLPISRSLITSTKFLFLCKATDCLGRAMWCRPLWGRLFYLPHMVIIEMLYNFWPSSLSASWLLSSVAWKHPFQYWERERALSITGYAGNRNDIILLRSLNSIHANLSSTYLTYSKIDSK